MKYFKYILFLLLIAIIGTAIYIAVQPNEFSVTRVRTIKAPSAVVYNNVIDFKNWEAWSAWVEADPDVKIMLSEQTKGVGGSYSWEDKDGTGTMKILDATEHTSINMQMQFEDFPPSYMAVNVSPNEDGSTEVTWNIFGKDLPFGFKAYATFTGGMEKQIGPNFERGLEKLDSIIVSSMKVYSLKIDGVTEYGGGFYLYKTTSATSSNISSIMGKQYGDIVAYMSVNNIAFNGMPFTIYNEMNQDNGNVIMSNAIPVKEKIVILGENTILCDYMPKVNVLKATLKGNYTNLGEAWQVAYNHIKDNGLTLDETIKPFEIYTTAPGDFPNPADWITEIYIPIKE